MRLTEQDIQEFREQWARNYGEQISRKFATKRAHQILELYSLLARSRARRSSKSKNDSPIE